MIALVTLLALAGTYLLYSALAHGRRHLPFTNTGQKSSGRKAADWMAQAGMAGVTLSEFVVVEFAVIFGVSLFAWLLFAGIFSSIIAGLLCATAPVGMFRGRRRKLREQARDSWPLLIEELRLQTGSLGRSIPVALFEVGKKAPTGPMQVAFEASHREWMLSTDFGRAIRVLKDNLADPTADMICETLAIAHELGGSDLEKRLNALIEDRRVDLRNRKEAISRQAGAKFARYFVLVVPLGMAMIGLTIGGGRSSYASAGGQIAVAFGLLLMGACWLWASSIMRLPEVERVFDK